jgi:hypothetical protein
MAAKGAASGSLNATNLEALGAARLAELLILLCEGNNASRRLLRLALAEQKGPLEMARELRKRLASITRSDSLLDDRQRDELLRDWFHQASSALGQVALAARGKPQNLADQVYACPATIKLAGRRQARWPVG